MKSSTTTTFTASILALTSFVTNTCAAKYNAACVFDELKCDGTIQLREYTPDTTNKCETGDCAAIVAPNVTSFSVLPTCADNHLTDTEKHLKGKPYVIVETYSGTGCMGDFTKAVAVVASGKCFPSRTGNMSYQVTLGASDLSVTWMEFTGGNCSTNVTTMSFPACEADRETCVKNKIRVLAVKPGSASNSTKPSMQMEGDSMSASSPAKSSALPAVLNVAPRLVVAAAMVAIV
jgi:hypothetical protein